MTDRVPEIWVFGFGCDMEKWVKGYHHFLPIYLHSVHKYSAGVGAGIVRVRVWPALKFHISGALTLNFLKM